MCVRESKYLSKGSGREREGERERESMGREYVGVCLSIVPVSVFSCSCTHS